MTFSQRAVEAGKAAMESKRAELQHLPLARVYDELASARLTAALAVDGVALQGWQDISTAPKDGTGFLFYQPVVGGRRIIDAGYFDGDLFRAVDFYQTDDPVVNPTHWMPLPTPPAASEGEERK